MMRVARTDPVFITSSMPAIATPPFRVRFFLLLLMGCSWAALCCLPARAEESAKKLTVPGIDAADPAPELAPEPEHESPWFVLPAMINVHPKLESEKLIEELFNPAMRLLAPGFRDVRTIASLRDEYILWTPDLAIGRVMSRHWAAYIHLGYSAGKVRTKSQDTSMFLMPLHTDFEIYRSAAYIGLCADIFPWGMPERRQYHGLWDRLRHTKPLIGLRVTETYASYKAKAKCGFTDFTRFLNLELSDRWWVTTFNANLGADIPLNKQNALALNAGYNVACTQGFDFDGAAFTVGWKHYFK
ncbi:MAG: hypothetical protein NTZ09_00950 [Candidatus Hydrogenedentes bacterium]|nr:hypothetical protein [Candidatus Hydrogenedentota bacterium]